MAQPGVFIISLDFELYWGLRDTLSFDRHRANLFGAREAVPRILSALVQNNVHATWATVGLLFFDRKDDLLAHLPAVLPTYHNPALSPYPDLGAIGATERDDPCRYGLSLIREIASHPGQEIGTHTFSHYYCREPGQTAAAFRADMAAAVAAASRIGLTLRSLVFPKNQCNPAYLRICRDFGITAYRGVERSWMHEPGAASVQQRTARRVARLLDHYVNLTGHHDTKLGQTDDGLPTNLPASRFLRPTSPRTRYLDSLRLRRICSSMTQAARNGTLFHLWWHPHNFGSDPDANLALLGHVLSHYQRMAERHGMVSKNMSEVARASHKASPLSALRMLCREGDRAGTRAAAAECGTVVPRSPRDSGRSRAPIVCE